MCSDEANILHQTKCIYFCSRREVNFYGLLHEEEREFGNMPDVLPCFHFFSPQPLGWRLQQAGLFQRRHK